MVQRAGPAAAAAVVVTRLLLAVLLLAPAAAQAVVAVPVGTSAVGTSAVRATVPTGARAVEVAAPATLTALAVGVGVAVEVVAPSVLPPIVTAPALRAQLGPTPLAGLPGPLALVAPPAPSPTHQLTASAVPTTVVATTAACPNTTAMPPRTDAARTGEALAERDVGPCGPHAAGALLVWGGVGLMCVNNHKIALLPRHLPPPSSSLQSAPNVACTLNRPAILDRLVHRSAPNDPGLDCWMVIVLCCL